MSDALTYTQSSVAFPTLPMRDRELDHINVQGPESSIEFRWIELGNQHKSGALQITAFSDAFGTLLDARILDLLDELRSLRETERDITPRQLTEMLDAVGATPSSYHLRGLDIPGMSMEQRAVLNERIKAAER